MGTSFTNLRFFFYKRIFPRLLEELNCGRVKLFAEALELFMHAVFQIVFPPQKKMEVGRC